MTEVVLVLTTVPTEAVAESIGRALVEASLAACVNVLPAMTSIYKWRGTLERSSEHQLVIKSTSSRVAEVEATIRALHPYELPELLVLHADGGSEDYRRWVRISTGVEA